jgi:tellurite resistance protein TerC
VFIGLKMLAEMVHFKVPVFVSLLVIVLCITASIIYSISTANRDGKADLQPGETDLH